MFADFILKLQPKLLAEERIIWLPIAGAQIPVLSQADVLLALDLPEIEINVPLVSAWLRHLVLRTQDIEAAAELQPRPNVIARLSVLAKGLGNTSLSRQLHHIVVSLTPYPVSPKSTGIGTRIQIPDVLAPLPRGSGSLWRDRQTMALARHRDMLAPLIEQMVGEPPAVTRRTLLAHARRANSYDAYHNTTLEGYRITPEAADAVISGRKIRDPHGPELRTIMAVQGYSHAFDYVVDEIGGF